MDSTDQQRHSPLPEPAAQPQHIPHIPQSTSLPLRSACSTPISSTGLFSPSSSRHNLALPHGSISESNTPAPTANSPFLHPLHTHRVRETHKALIDSDNLTGRKSINQYEVIEEIGRGMHGKVKLARNLETSENVAIKIIPRFSKKRRLGKLTALSPQDKTKKEIAILKKIRHPNVVALLEVIDDPELKKIHMVLEHVELGEIVWRKKGLPHICQYERQRVEKEMGIGAPTAQEEQYNKILERRQALKDLKRAKMAEHYAGPSDYWSVEYGAADETGSSVGHWSRVTSNEDFVNNDHRHSPPGSRRSSFAAARSMSIASTGLMPSDQAEDIEWMDDLETPGPGPGPTALESTHASMVALDGTMYGPYQQDTSPEKSLRGRSPSVADSIISHMSSVDYNPNVYDPFAEDYSFVPCFTFEQARSTFRDTVLGLEYLHYQGVVHRDIKPANLLWTKDHRVKISDFGVSYFGRPIRDGEPDDTVSESEAKDFDDDLELAKTVGTPAFFAPELCYTDFENTPQPKVSEQIDVWSLGVTLYCLIYARIPFLAEDEFQMFRKIATEEVHISRKRLKPVDPSTSPDGVSLFKRQNADPYRDDNDLEYEDVDNLLYDLLRLMLTKNPEKRIKLRDIKRHPWVVQGIANPVGWLDDTDPARPSQGRKIQVDEKDVSYAVVPLTFLERARSVMKKAVGKVINPLVDRSDSKTRRRATSSVASSAGDSGLRYAGPGLPHNHGDRGAAEDSFSPGRSRSPVQHHGTSVPTAADATHYDPLATVLQPSDTPTKQRHHLWTPPSQRNGNGAAGGDHVAATASSRRFQRHVGHSKLTQEFLQLAPPLPQTQSTPTTPHAAIHPHAHTHRDIIRQSRGTESRSEQNSRSTSVERAIAMPFGSAPNQRPSLPVRSVDLGRGYGFATPSPISSSPRERSKYQHSHPQSDPNLRSHSQDPPELAERAANDASSVPGHDEAGATIGEVNTRAVTESSDAYAHAHVQPGQMWTQPASISRGEVSATKSSSLESIEGLGTPLTNVSEATSPVDTGMEMESPSKDASQQLSLFQSNPSLPALLSNASSVSADMDAEVMAHTAVMSDQSSRYAASGGAVTPPALAKDTNGIHLDSFLENTPSVGSDTLRLHLEPVSPSQLTTIGPDTTTPGEEEDDDSDDGLLLMASKKKKSSASPTSSHGRPFEAKRRDTSMSTASTETAKKVPVYGDDAP